MAHHQPTYEEAQEFHRQVDAEIARLCALSLTVPAVSRLGDNNRRAIHLQIATLSVYGNFSLGELIHTADGDEYIEEAIDFAWAWADGLWRGKTSRPPSSDWNDFVSQESATTSK